MKWYQSSQAKCHRKSYLQSNTNWCIQENPETDDPVTMNNVKFLSVYIVMNMMYSERMWKRSSDENILH